MFKTNQASAKRPKRPTNLSFVQSILEMNPQKSEAAAEAVTAAEVRCSFCPVAKQKLLE